MSTGILPCTTVVQLRHAYILYGQKRVLCAQNIVMTISSCDTIHRLSSDVLQEFQALGHYSEKVFLPEIILDRNSAKLNHLTDITHQFYSSFIGQMSGNFNQVGEVLWGRNSSPWALFGKKFPFSTRWDTIKMGLKSENSGSITWID